jgi:AcrR family transcriptional regulator
MAPDDEELLEADERRELATSVVAEALGPEWAARIGGVWQRLEEWDRRTNPGEGLRERKKRQTRQTVSDVATALFLARGYDNVKVSEIAQKVGVSEKTIYNYFPTKESLVYDQADEQLLRLATAIRDRAQGTSPTSAFVVALKADVGRFNEALREPDAKHARLEFLTAFAEMIRDTPALRAAWGEHRHRMVDMLTGILADEAHVDPRDPEPITAARALVSLLELVYDSQMRHIADGVSPNRLQQAIEQDLDRAARLLDTGLWSFNLMVEGRRTKDQLREAGLAAEQARQLVMKALREAKQAFREIRDQTKVAERQHRETRKDVQRAHTQGAREAGRRLRGKGR